MRDPATHETIRIVGDAMSIVTVVGALADALPAIAALFTILWTAIRIYETTTVQLIVHRIAKRKRRKGTD